METSVLLEAPSLHSLLFFANEKLRQLVFAKQALLHASTLSTFLIFAIRSDDETVYPVMRSVKRSSLSIGGSGPGSAVDVVDVVVVVVVVVVMVVVVMVVMVVVVVVVMVVVVVVVVVFVVIVVSYGVMVVE